MTVPDELIERLFAEVEREHRCDCEICSRPGAPLCPASTTTLILETAGRRLKAVENAEEIGRLKQWVADLQAGTFITCVYCGHRYGPDDEVPAAMADVLKEHIQQCAEHPMAAYKAFAEIAVDALDRGIDSHGAHGPCNNNDCSTCAIAYGKMRAARELCP